MVRRIGFDACRIDMGLECWLCLRVKNRAQAAQIAYELKDKTVDMVAEIKRKTKARSKDANAYAWELMGQMADLLHTDKDSVYLEIKALRCSSVSTNTANNMKLLLRKNGRNITAYTLAALHTPPRK